MSGTASRKYRPYLSLAMIERLIAWGNAACESSVEFRQNRALTDFLMQFHYECIKSYRSPQYTPRATAIAENLGFNDPTAEELAAAESALIRKLESSSS
jgi:hypothetical protein